MAKLKANIEGFYYYTEKENAEILFQILEQVDLLGKDNLDSLGSCVLEILKRNCLIFENNILVTK